MRAVQFQNPGEPASVLQLQTVERPVPKHGEVLVRMLATPVNPSDLMYIRGHYTIPAQCPATPGFEGVGIVEASGGGLRGMLFRGKRVVVLNKRGGNWADYAVVPADQVIPISRSLSDEQAATFFVNPATAWVMTREVLRVPSGGWLVQTAAGSALGQMIVRLSKTCGFRTINIVRREAQRDELLRLGADQVEVCDGSDESCERLTAQLQKLTGGVRYAVDAVGGSTGSAVVRSLGLDGRMLAYGTLSGQPLQFSPRTLMTVGSSVEGFWLGNFMKGVGLPFKLSLVRRLTRLIQSGVLSTEISGSWTLETVADAVVAAEKTTQSARGKCLLRI
ncbi:MAG: zinc-dependent alcohol dehydrogenase family protein [Planctomycetaceae bacterium]